MPRGRPRKPENEAKMDGLRRKKIALVEVFVPEGLPFIPEHVHDDAQLCAEQIIAGFQKVKHLSSLDSYLITVFASAWAWHKKAMEMMNAPDFDPVITSGRFDTQKANPWFEIAATQAKLMLAIAPKLFLSPADRMTLNIARGEDEKPPSKFDGLFGNADKRPSRAAARAAVRTPAVPPARPAAAPHASAS